MLKSSYFSPKEQPETVSLSTIGQKLKSAREAQGLSLVQVHERTKIPLHHLQSIDSGDGEDLPEPVYVAGFIKRYAECVGLDGQVLGDDYKRSLETNGKRQKAAPVPMYATTEYISKSKIRMTPSFSFKTWTFNFIIAIGLVGLICYVFKTQQDLANQPDPSLLPLRESTNRLAPANMPATAGQPAAAPAQPAPVSNRVSLSSTKHVWVEVKKLSSGENCFNGYMEQGDRRDFEDPQGIWVRAGNGGSLSVECRGKIEPFGLEGKVTDRSFATGAPTTTTATADGKPAATGSTVASSPTVISRPVRRSVVRRQSSSEDGGGSSRAHRAVDSGGYRSIGGDGGSRSIDVPYRYNGD